MTATDAQPEKQYRPFYAFTDQGELVFPAHFAVAIAECDDAACAHPLAQPAAELDGTITLVAKGARGGAAAETILVRGHARAAEVTIPTKDSETYAYFGALQEVETPDVIGIIDRGYPPAIRRRFDTLVAPLFALYAKDLGVPPATDKPLLFASFMASDHHDFGGGVIPPRVVNLAFNLSPQELHAIDAKVLGSVDLILAHEVAHLWNTDLYSHDEGGAAAWMHEGSADALAFRALRRLGALDEATYRARLSTSVSLCALALSEGKPLSASARPGYTRNLYECGNTIALITEGAVHKRNVSSNLFTFWKDLFNARGNRSYGEALYFATLDRLGADPTTTETVRRLVKEPIAHPAAEIAQALARVGVQLRPREGPLPLDYQEQSSAVAVRALLAPACVAALGFRGTHRVEPRVMQDGACGQAVRDDVIEKLAGVALGAQGGSAFDAGFAQCMKSRTLDVGRTGKPSITLPCADPPRARTPYFEITRAF